MRNKLKKNISKAVSESNKNRANPTLVNLPNMESTKPTFNTSEKLAEKSTDYKNHL